MHIHEYSHIHSYSFTVFGGLRGVFMNSASPTEFMNNSLHIHIHQKIREGITLYLPLVAVSRHIYHDIYHLLSGGSA